MSPQGDQNDALDETVLGRGELGHWEPRAEIYPLLDELEKLDPATYVKIVDMGVVGNSTHPDQIWMDEAITQKAVQDAIVEIKNDRGEPIWFVSIWLHFDRWEAVIRRGPAGYTDPNFAHMGEGCTPSAAILAAYVAARKAMR